MTRSTSPTTFQTTSVREYMLNLYASTLFSTTAVSTKLGVILVGGTNAGKTSLSNLLGSAAASMPERASPTSFSRTEGATSPSHSAVERSRWPPICAVDELPPASLTGNTRTLPQVSITRPQCQRQTTHRDTNAADRMQWATATQAGRALAFLTRSAYSLLNTHYTLLTTHYSLLTTHYSLTHYSLLTTHYALLIAASHVLTTHYSLLTAHYCTHSLRSLLTTHYSLLTTHYSLLTTQLLTTHYSLLTTHYSSYSLHRWLS